MSIATLQAAQPPLGAHRATLEHAPPVSHEAARYALIRRMGSAIRHQLAGALQPVSMLASLLERRVQAQTPNLESLRKNAAEISSLCRSTNSECVALMSWLAPQEGDLVAAGEGVDDCLSLLATELSFRGFFVVNTAVGQDALVGRPALRALLPASLLALTDAATQSAQVLVSVASSGEAVTVSVALAPAEREEPAGSVKGYRALTWQDVEALAAEEHVTLRMTADGVDLVFDRAYTSSSDNADVVRWS